MNPHQYGGQCIIEVYARCDNFFPTITTSSLPTTFFLPGTASGFWNPEVSFAFQKLTAVPFANPAFSKISMPFALWHSDSKESPDQQSAPAKASKRLNCALQFL